MDTALEAAETAFLEAGGTAEQWAGGVKGAIEAQLVQANADAAVQQAVKAAMTAHKGGNKPESEQDRAYAAMRGKISL